MLDIILFYYLHNFEIFQETFLIENRDLLNVNINKKSAATKIRVKNVYNRVYYQKASDWDDSWGTGFDGCF